MQNIESLTEISRPFNLTIGNFDGVHLGHQSLLSHIKQGPTFGANPLAVITFVPHPVEVLTTKKHFLINTYEARRVLLQKHGVDYLVEIPFSRDLSTQAPETFLDDQILKAKDYLKSFHIGHDFAFGANKNGNYEFMIKYASKHHFPIIIHDALSVDNNKVSSSLIRAALLNGDIKNVQKFLGREFYIEGSVVKGFGRGRPMGFATANLLINEHQLLPKSGVYVSTTKINNMVRQSVTSIGTNPTFKDSLGQISCETHILDFDEMIYGEKICVTLLHLLREEQYFDTKAILISQIQTDVLKTRAYFHDQISTYR